MGGLHQLDPKTPRKMRDTEWTEGGMRLSPAKRVVDSDWFWPAILTSPPGVSLIVLF